MMMNDVRLSRMTALAEMMAAAALLSACGGGGRHRIRPSTRNRLTGFALRWR